MSVHSSGRPAETARDWLLNGETAAFVAVAPQPKDGATELYRLVLDLGWRQSSIAAGMYLTDAWGVAHALSEVLECPLQDWTVA
jgi:hypothetical protein